MNVLFFSNSNRFASVLLVALAATSSCVVPQHLERDVTGDDNTPTFLPGTQPPQLFVLTQGEQQAFTVRVTDADPQPIYARLFVDATYDRPIPFASGADIAPWLGNPRRTFDFDVDGLCDTLINGDILRSHVLELYVSDAEFDSERSDQRYPTDDGNWNSTLWLYTCEAAQ